MARTSTTITPTTRVDITDGEDGDPGQTRLEAIMTGFNFAALLEIFQGDESFGIGLTREQAGTLGSALVEWSET